MSLFKKKLKYSAETVFSTTQIKGLEKFADAWVASNATAASFFNGIGLFPHTPKERAIMASSLYIGMNAAMQLIEKGEDATVREQPESSGEELAQEIIEEESK